MGGGAVWAACEGSQARDQTCTIESDNAGSLTHRATRKLPERFLKWNKCQHLEKSMEK